MDAKDVLIDAIGRMDEHIAEVVDGLGADDLVATVAPGTNPIGWLLWHLTRVEDHHVSEVLDEEQLWVTWSWGDRFGIPSDPDNNGYGHGPDDVAAVRPDGVDALVEYHRAVADRTRAYLGGLGEAELDRVIDERWDPPVTLGVRLVSIIDDEVQHAGQAKYLKGLLERR